MHNADAEHKFIDGASDWGFGEMVSLDEIYTPGSQWLDHKRLTIKVK